MLDTVAFVVSSMACLLWTRQPQPQHNRNPLSSSASSSSSSSSSASALASSSLQARLHQGTTLNATERVCTVTAENVPIEGGHARRDMRLQKLWHRATFCVIKHEPPRIGQHDDTYVLVQQRSSYKDYCPGRYDATPGGVVGYNESYNLNITRELQEEMGMDTSIPSSTGHPLKRLFTFPYQDEAVKVWGELYECTYKGTLHELTLQPEEVQGVVRMSLEELQDQMTTSPEQFMPDTIHAVQLYRQHMGDLKVKRRFLKGSSTDLDMYQVRPRPQAIFFDCDDCLYFDGWKTAQRLTAKIDGWCTTKGGLPPGKAYELYKQYGTALRGLLAEGYLEKSPQAIASFLEDVHDIGVEDLLTPDPTLRQLILALDPSIPRYIFTASVEHHAQRCITALGIADLFHPTIIDCQLCDFESKHSHYSFKVAMTVAGITNPKACLFFDDSLTNIKAARHVGWRAILVGKVGRDCGKPITSEHAELEIDTIHQIHDVCPELFV